MTARARVAAGTMHDEDWRRAAMRHDRCAHASFAAITLAAIVTFRL